MANMRILLFSVAIMLLTVASAWSDSRQDRYVTPIKNGVGVFANNPMSAGEKPVYTADTGNWLMVMESKGDMLKVTDMHGKVGWIQKASVKLTTPNESMKFSGADVLGYLDNPTPIMILDAANPVGSSIALDRSFSDELKENVDKITIDRIVGEHSEQW